MRTITVFFLVCFIGSLSQAQNLSFGPTAGFGHGWMNADNFPAGTEKKFHPSWNAGGKLVYSFQSNWGVSADLLVSGEGGRFESSPNTKTEVEDEVVSEQDTKHSYNGFDFGLKGSAGVNVRVSPNTWLNTDLRYYHGLLDVSESANAVQNRNLRLNVGLLFGIGTVRPK